MSDYISLTTVAEVRKAIRKARNVFVEVRIGNIEREIIVSKKEAMYIFEDLDAKDTAEMHSAYGDTFAKTTPDGYTIWIG